MTPASVMMCENDGYSIVSAHDMAKIIICDGMERQIVTASSSF